MTEPAKSTGGDSEEEATGGGSYSASNEGNFGDSTFGANLYGPTINFPAPTPAPLAPQPQAAAVPNNSIIIIGIFGVVALAIYLLFGRD